jgi:hypothetical protein
MTYPTTDFELEIPLVYMETTIPAGITIAAYRRSRPARAGLRRWLMSRLLPGA